MCNVDERKELDPQVLASLEGLLVDCKRKPFIPTEYLLVDHTPREEFVWTPERIAFRPMLELVNPAPGDYKDPDRLYNELSLLPVCNANVLDFLSENPSDIPGDLNNKLVFFLGTTFTRQRDGVRYVRCLRKRAFWSYEMIWWCGLMHSSYYVALYAK